MIIGCSKKNAEKYPKGAFELRNKETWIQIEPWIRANQPLINWVLYSLGNFGFSYP